MSLNVVHQAMSESVFEYAFALKRNVNWSIKDLIALGQSQLSSPTIMTSSLFLAAYLITSSR